MRSLGLAVLCLLAVPLLSGVARADVAACPGAPSGYSGTDAVVAAVTQLDADTVASCAALSDRLDALAQDITQAGGAAHDDAVAAQRVLGDIKTIVDGWTATSPLHVTLPDGGAGQAVAVTNWPSDQTVGLDATSAEAFDGQAQSEHGDLWVIVGVMVGVFCAGQVLRKVWP